jgi:predicted MPP superfamily phosphohydrolase
MEFLRTFLLIALFVLQDWLTYKGVCFAFPAFREHRHKQIQRIFIIQIVFMLAVVAGGAVFSRFVRDFRIFAVYYYFFGLVLMIYGFKMVFLLSLVPDVFFSRRYRKKRRIKQLFPKNPRHLWAKAGVVAGILLIIIMIWGICCERYNYEVNQVELSFGDLPTSFDNFRIVQISDLHCGSLWGSKQYFERLVDIINSQHADLIVCTGDFVNIFADEMVSVIPLFRKLNPATQKLAVPGNHDYGAYTDWNTAADSIAHQRTLEHNIALMGFTLLKNRATVIEKDSLNRIAVVGVENWGTRRRKNYPRRGNITEATGSVQDIPFKILLSHDPTFWQMHIQEKTNIQLTLSGHTHGTQMGIRMGKFKFSPSQMMYPYWAGLYEVNGQYLYVNRGVGVIGFPGRIGMPPEITVFTLKCKSE